MILAQISQFSFLQKLKFRTASQVVSKTNEPGKLTLVWKHPQVGKIHVRSNHDHRLKIYIHIFNSFRDQLCAKRIVKIVKNQR